MRRWATNPVVRVAQNEKQLAFPSELDLAWSFIQRHLDITSPSGNIMANIICNFNSHGSLTYLVNEGMSDAVLRTELAWCKLFTDSETLAAPMYCCIIRAMISYEQGDKRSALSYTEAIFEHVRKLVLYLYNNMNDPNISRAIWVRHVSGIHSWGLTSDSEHGPVEYGGLSGSQTLIFLAIDAFLGIVSYHSEEEIRMHISKNMREVFAAMKKYCFRSELSKGGSAEDQAIMKVMDRIVKQMRTFRGVHKVRAVRFLSAPAPERVPMTAALSVLDEQPADEKQKAPGYKNIQFHLRALLIVSNLGQRRTQAYTDSEFRLSKSLTPSTTANVTHPGAWPYLDYELHADYLRQLIEQVDAKPEQPLSPAVQRLKEAIETKSHLYMYFTEMFTEIPAGLPYGDWQVFVRDYNHLLQLLSHIVTTAPPPGMTIPLPPMAMIFTFPASTASGHAAFSDPEVNRLLKGILNEWSSFLGSPDSRSYLRNGSDDGWLASRSIADLEGVANLPKGTAASFSEIFDCDSDDEYYGFESWDGQWNFCMSFSIAVDTSQDFFTRRFRPHMRPVADPDDDDVVINACESVPHTVGKKAKLRDTFFVKGQPYSVLDMLGHRAVASKFANSTVFQAFLSLHSYHRWHAPVSGKIHSAYLIDGTYFSLPRFQSVDQLGSDGHTPPVGFGHAMRYLSEMATRAAIIIEADNPRLGLVAFIAVGMVDISSCEITVKEGQHVRKGDELGSFHFGGSSYCLLFQDGVELTDLPSEGNFQSPNLPVRGKIAVLSSAASELKA
ncbi:hypothetical protein NLG97_g4565 [Lecanicillium saksenae]|uniref:Uncharacterized protein n=1 Tax=Lecanicillium saksenae TaxID=468837 RepID=A0ACC1QY78_9HYPO|nr:hypothetical protein NLG97_g4565 [Lecanicillium saksenae]